MKFLVIVLIVSCFSFSGFAQSNTNTNSNSNSIQHNEILITPMLAPEEAEKELDKSTELKKNTIDQSTLLQSKEVQSRAVFSANKTLSATQLNSRTPSEEQQFEMNQVVDFYKQNAPESFEYNYFTYVAGNYNISLFPYLQKAHQLKPTNTDVLVLMAGYHFIMNDTNALKEELTTLVSIDKIPADIVRYDKTLLASVSPNGTLLTHGFEDAFGCLYLQKTQNFRTDVQLISLDLMKSEVYRESLRKSGYEIPASSVIDVSFFSALCALNQAKKLHVSMTFPKPYLETIVSQVGAKGLVFVFDQSESEFETNEQIWKTLQEQQTLNSVYSEKGKQLTANYLPMLFELRSTYKTAKNPSYRQVEEMIQTIGVYCNKSKQVKQLLLK